MGVRELDKHIRLSPEVERTLRIAAAKLDLSPRAYHRVIKVARTIADLAGSEDITEAHLLEALAYRPKQGGA
jgi:magnesium chelatase family protein